MFDENAIFIKPVNIQGNCRPKKKKRDQSLNLNFSQKQKYQKPNLAEPLNIFLKRKLPFYQPITPLLFKMSTLLIQKQVKRFWIIFLSLFKMVKNTPLLDQMGLVKALFLN